MEKIITGPTAPTGAPRPARAVLGATTTTIASVLPVFLIGGLAVQLGAELRFSPAGLGLAVSVYFGVSALASVPSGRLVDRWGPVAVARAGIVLSAASLLAIGLFARSFPLLVTLLAISAGANALGQLASNAALARQVPPGHQGLSFGVKQAAIPASTLLAGAAVPAIALTVGWRWAFIAAAAAALTALALVPTGVGAERARTVPDGARATSALVTIGVAATLASGAANALGTFLVDSAVVRGINPALAGLTLTLGSAICVAGRVLAGWLADRRSAGHLATIAGMLVVGAVGLALLATGGPVALTLGVTLGFGLGWAWPGLMNFAVVRLHPQAPATATSITQTGVYAGGALGPLVLGAVATHADYPRMWLTAAVAMVVAAALMLTGGRMLRATT
ncbi:Predicted arabinose efflux permease, MFS family [Micromonospora pattaloongensis]|uniref:Predicted arabinose efflux permease, MFS family n=1 Tax=Micromonospora pattaloongensis TaxID=405436 RepID=A0A1H3SEN1_9ACTN|nr:MFS transporter [Micromonospora pattaloongensis]SDZ36055.1 Predicted arabinose efflux permease, MFS family [Micromonospora pattaloongensis]